MPSSGMKGKILFIAPACCPHAELTTAISATIEPADRSVPPEMMTKHTPSAMMP